MKFLVQIGLAAVTLFSVSAALSVWLYQSRQPQPADAAETEKAAAKKLKEKEPERAPEKEPADPKAGKTADPGPAAGGTDPAALAALRDREARADRRAAQTELVLRDLQEEREANELLIRRANAEIKQAAARVAEAATAPPPADTAKAKAESEAAERKNIERMATLYDAMAPEAAAPILRQMADSGRMDTAARVLSMMKDRQAARLLGELGDTALAAQLLDRMRQLRPTPPPGAAPATLPPTRPSP